MTFKKESRWVDGLGRIYQEDNDWYAICDGIFGYEIGPYGSAEEAYNVLKRIAKTEKLPEAEQWEIIKAIEREYHEKAKRRRYNEEI